MRTDTGTSEFFDIMSYQARVYHVVPACHRLCHAEDSKWKWMWYFMDRSDKAGWSGICRWYGTTSRVTGKVTATFHQVRKICKSTSRRPKWCKWAGMTKIYLTKKTNTLANQLVCSKGCATSIYHPAVAHHSRSASICPLCYQWQCPQDLEKHSEHCPQAERIPPAVSQMHSPWSRPRYQWRDSAQD